MNVLQPSTQERIHERVAFFFEFFEPRILEEIVDVAHLLPQEYSQELVGQLGLSSPLKTAVSSLRAC